MKTFTVLYCLQAEILAVTNVGLEKAEKRIQDQEEKVLELVQTEKVLHFLSNIIEKWSYSKLKNFTGLYYLQAEILAVTNVGLEKAEKRIQDQEEKVLELVQTEKVVFSLQ